MKKKRIAEIAIEIKTGKTPPTSRQEYFGDEINWYTPTDLDRQKNLSVSTRGLTQLAIDDKKAVLFKPNTVLIGCIGDIGKIGIAKSIASSNQQITGVLTDGNEIYPDYFYYWLKINKRILQNASTNAVVPILNNKQLGDIKISYHDYLTDQIKIAQVLTQAEKLIAQRKESIALLDEYLKSTFLEMFGDYKLMSNSKLDTLGNNISYLTSGSRGWAQYYSNSGAKFLRIQNIGGGTIRTDNLISVNPPESAETLRTRVMEGDLLISITADIGRTSVVPKDFGEAYINQHLALIRLNKNINPVYAAYFYNMPFGNNATTPLS
jgi:type I restriction enzyme S subunit